MRYVFRPEDRADSARLGGKARALASFTKAGLPVPRWFVVAPEAFLDSLDEDDRHAFHVAQELSIVQGLLTRLTVSGAVQAELVGALEALVPDGGLVAVRSSAVDEDSAEHSFAGQLDSFLYVAPADVTDRMVAVWRSGFGERLRAYRRERGLTRLPTAPAVIVQRGTIVAALPANTPTPQEITNCAPHLAAELGALPHVRVVVALGRIAAVAYWRLAKARGPDPRPRPAFAHDAVFVPGRDGVPALVMSYHPSRQNTNTGRLTAPMLEQAFRTARRLAGDEEFV